MKKLIAKIQKILHDRRTRQFLTRFVSVTAAIVVFVTTYALVLPAITMEREAHCGIPAHQHDDSCYEEVLVCGLEESKDHQHTADCYEKKLVCGMEAHTHSPACYGDEVSADDKENAAVAATHSLTGAVSGTEGNDDSFDAYTGDFEGTDGTVNKSIQEADDEADNYEENATGASFDEMSTDAPTDSQDKTDNGASAGETASDPISEEKDSEISARETASDTISGEKDSEILAEEKDSEIFAGETASGAVSEANSAEIDQADTARTETVSGENINADPYVPALEPIDFNTVLTSSTGIYYYHKDPEAGAETDVDADDKTTPVTSAEITDWKPVEEDTILAPEDLIRVYLRYSVPAGKLNSTNILARYRLPENLVLSEEQVTAINKTENGISAQYMDYDTLEVKDPAAHEESLGVEAIEGIRTPDQDVDEYLAGISGPEGDAREYISATVKVENVYAENSHANEENYEKETAVYGNEGHADNGEIGSDSAWLGQDLIFTFTPYTVEKNRHEYDSSGQPTKAGREVDGWLTLDFNMSQVKWVETDRDAQTVEQVTDTEPEDDIEDNEHDSGETADHSDLGTKDEVPSDKEEGNPNSGKQDTLDPSENVKTIITTTVRKEAEIVFVEEIKKDRDHNIESRDEISTKLSLVETSAAETEAHADVAAVDEETTARSKTQNANDSKKQGGDKEKEEKDKENDQEEAEKESEKEVNKLTVAMPAATFEDSIVVRSGSLTSDTTATEPEETEITVHVEADKDTFPEGVKMVLKTVSEKELEAVASAVEDAVSNDDTVSNKTRGFHALDISFVDKDGREIEPLKPIRVSMSSEAIRAAVEDQTTAPVVVHVNDDNSDTDAEAVDPDKTENRETPENSENQKQDIFENREENKGTVTEATVIVTESAKQNPAEQNASESEEKNSTDAITFTSDSFSVYAIVYTVDFHFEVNGRVFEFSIHGGETVSLKTVLSALNIVPGEEGEEKYSGSEQNFTNAGGDSAPGDNDAQENFEEPAEDNSDSSADGDDKTTAPLYEDAEEFISNIESVTFTNEDLLRIAKITGNTTAAALKEALGLVVEPSAEITEEKLAEYDAREFIAPDWALISLKPFDTEEKLTINLKNDEVITILVTDLNENPFGLNGKKFKIVNNSRAMTRTTSNDNQYHSTLTSSQTISNGETWEFEYTGQGTGYLIKNSQGQYLLMDVTTGLTFTDRQSALAKPIVVKETIDTNGKRGYVFMDSSEEHCLRYNNNSFYLSTSNLNLKDPNCCMELRDPSNTSKPGTVNTADTRSEDIIINLFDYGPDSLDNNDNLWSHSSNSLPNNYQNLGINNGHPLKFMCRGTGLEQYWNGWGWSTYPTTINTYSDPGQNNNKYVAVQGIVQSQLNNSGFPVLYDNSDDLGYLFDTSEVSGAKTVYENLNHFFIKDEMGYYRYNSNENYAYYDITQNGNGDNGDFKIYAGTYNEEGTAPGDNEAIGFFPFDDYNAANQCVHGNDFGWCSSPYNHSYNNHNHHFGMSLDASFVMTPDGKYLGDDIVFNFSGDDDLWVFVDGVLVLDIGGVHNPVTGQINFNTGKVTISDEVNGGTNLSQMVVNNSLSGPTSIQEAFSRVDGKEWNNNPYSRHSLKVFYLERGGMYSNLAIDFNLPTYKTITVEKELEGLPEAQQQRYENEYFYYQVNIDGQPYTGEYGVLTRPATQEELANWEWDTQDKTSGHWTDGSPHTETINKNNELVKWHILVKNGIVRVKPGWTFTIEELPQGSQFSVAELYGYDSAYEFYDGQADNPQTQDLMEPFLAPTAEYTYYDTENRLDYDFHEEDLPLSGTPANAPRVWSSAIKDVEYSDHVLFTNYIPTLLEVEKEWYDSNGNIVTDTSDSEKYIPINYKIYRIPYRMVDDPVPENPNQKKRIDYPVQEVIKTEVPNMQGKVVVPSMKGFTGQLKYDSNPDNSWKEEVTNLPRVGKYTLTGQTEAIDVFYEYYVTEETDVPGFKYLIEGGATESGEHEGEYRYVIKNEPLSPIDQFTNIDIEKEWRDAQGNLETDPDLHKNDSIVFEVTQKKYKAMAIPTKGEDKEPTVLYPITINLVDENGVVGGARMTDTIVVYVPKGASFVIEPIYNDSRNENEHVVAMGGMGVTVGTIVRTTEGTIEGPSPRTITRNTPLAPSNTYYYPNNPRDPDNPNSPKTAQLTFAFEDVDSAKEITLWLYAGNDQWVYLYDDDDPTNYLDKTEEQHQASAYHKWTCQLHCDKGIIWDLEEVFDHIVEHPDAYDLEEYPCVTKTPKYTMGLEPKNGGGYSTKIINGENAPGSGIGDNNRIWKGSIKNLPRYEFKNAEDGGTYIYTYEVTEAQIGSEVLDVSLVHGTEINPVLYNGQTSQYLVKWEQDDENENWKFTNKKKEITEVSASKNWVNPNGGPMAPPDGAIVTFELFADGEATGKTVVLDGTTIADQINVINAIQDDTVMTEEQKAAEIARLQALTFGELTTAWKAEWKNLQKYKYEVIDETSDEPPEEPADETEEEPVKEPIEIKYTVKETVEYSGYQNMNPDGVDGVNDNGVITNKQLKYNLKIVKVDADDRTIGLSGAKFQMTRKLPGESAFTKFDHDSFEVEENNKRTGPFTVSSPQGITLDGLVPGEYRIEEKVAPDGYNIILQPFTFTLVTDGTVTTSDSDNSLVVLFRKSGDDPSGLQIGNTPGSALPHTGGPGTKLFIFLGIMLTVFAGAGLIIRKTN